MPWERRIKTLCSNLIEHCRQRKYLCSLPAAGRSLLVTLARKLTWRRIRVAVNASCRRDPPTITVAWKRSRLSQPHAGAIKVLRPTA